MSIDELKRNILSVTERIERAASACGNRVTLVAATKTVPAEIIGAAIELGVENVGENRVQEYVEKKDRVQGAKWHFIGTLQRNKAKYLVGSVSLIQSVNSVELAKEIDRLALKRGVKQDVLIEVNVADEQSKTGVSFDCSEQLIDYATGLDNVTVRGLMAVAPIGADERTYRKIYRLFESRKRGAFDTLSVGMSGDFERAIACGSNMVRLGTAIFGRRI